MENEYPEVKNHDSFKQMVLMQKALLGHYITIEDLPAYPIDIKKRSSQKLVRNFINRFLEELGEACENSEEAFTLAQGNKREEACLEARLANVEIADAMHFLLELLIYLGMDDVLDDMLREKLKENGLEGLYVQNGEIKTLFNLGNYLNVSVDRVSSKFQFHLYNQFKIMDNPKLRGFHRISQMDLDMHAQFLWGVSRKLFKATNLLKNKDWVRQESDVNYVDFDNYILDAVIILFQFFDFAYMSELTLFYNYVDKNKINHERILKGY